MSSHLRNCPSYRLVLLLSLCFTGNMGAAPILDPVTIQDLVERVQIPMVSLAPDGSQVAYLTVKGLSRENLYEIRLNLQVTDGKRDPVVLSEYRLSPDKVFDRDTGGLEQPAGQVAWSQDSQRLAYTVWMGTRMALRVKTLSSSLETRVLEGFDTIVMQSNGNGLKVTTTGAATSELNDTPEPDDLALLVKDDYGFIGPLPNPKPRGKFIVEHWEYTWGSTAPKKTDNSISYLGFPKEVKTPKFTSDSTHDTRFITRDEVISPDKTLAATLEYQTINLADPVRAYRASPIVLTDLKKTTSSRILVPNERPRAILKILGWSHNSKKLYYVKIGPQYSSICAVSLNGDVGELYSEESKFSVPSQTSEISADSGTVVLVRSTNLVPDELIKIDLTSGAMTVLQSPNEAFKTKAHPIVRFVPIECCGGTFYGRLYLPSDYQKGKQYPLVFTNYVSDAGFDASTGDEVPVLVFVSHGLAVFAMNSREANVLSNRGDFRFEINRVEKPLLAMEWVRRKLAEEGAINAEKCGLTGLSYGAEIAMYAYWKADIFRAVSVATPSWEPTSYELVGIPDSKFLDSRGFALPEAGTYSKWKELSAGLNARPDLPPLLVQSPDGEEYGSVETWFRLRRAGAPVEWYEYPDEGHVKRGPANKWWVYERNLDWFRFWLNDEEDSNPAKTDQYLRWRAFRDVHRPLLNSSSRTVPSRRTIAPLNR